MNGVDLIAETKLDVLAGQARIFDAVHHAVRAGLRRAYRRLASRRA